MSAGRPDTVVLARIATRSCDGRPLLAAGVNLKSLAEGARPANAAARRGSAVAGVKVEILSRLRAIAGGRRLESLAPAANAGGKARPATTSVASSFPPFERLDANTPHTPVRQRI